MSLDDYVHQYLIKGYQGHFAAHLADAWCWADSSNRTRLETAFPDIFTVPQYLINQDA